MEITVTDLTSENPPAVYGINVGRIVQDTCQIGYRYQSFGIVAGKKGIMMKEKETSIII